MVTDSDPSVPTEVIFVWLAVSIVPVIVVADSDPDDIPLVTDSDPSVPIDVIFGWLAVCIVPVIFVDTIEVRPIIVPEVNLSEVPDPNKISPNGRICRSPLLLIKKSV